MNNYRNEEKCINRLVEEYHKYDNIIIACDFDETIFGLHDDTLEILEVVDLIRKCQEFGLTTCLWTACPDEWSLTYKKSICKSLNLDFKYFNESPVMNQSRKPHFSILLDDRAGLDSSYNILVKVIEILEDLKDEK